MKDNDKGLAQFEQYRVTLKTKYIQQDVFLTSIHDNIPIAHSGDIVVLSGPSKSGKSGICAAIIASNLRTKDNDADPIGLISPDNSGDAVLIFNTELSDRNFQRYYKSILNRYGKEEDEELLFAYNLNGLDAAALQEVTIQIIQEIGSKRRIRAVVIDGIADYIDEVNSERDSKLLVDLLMKMGRCFNFPMVLVIHTNPGSDKTRGHLGSFLERKCEAFLEIKPSKLPNTFILQAKFLRNAKLFQPIYFSFDEQKGYHRFAFIHEDVQRQTELEKREALQYKVMEAILVYFDGHDRLPKKELLGRIVSKDGIGLDAARKRVNKYVQDDFLMEIKDDVVVINFKVESEEGK